jgi:fatty acid desaturase
MSGKALRRTYIQRFLGLTRYSRATAWMIVAAYLGLIAMSVALGAYLLSVPVSIWSVGGIVATVIFIGTRLRGINNILHECCHATFAQDRRDNMLIGNVCASLLMKSFRKYRLDHMTHHAHNGDYEKDADLAHIQKFRLHDPISLRTVLRHFVTPLTGRHLPYYTGINLSAEDGRFFVGLKIGLLVATAVFLLLSPIAALLMVVVPLFYVYPTLSYWADCFDHAGLVGADEELEASRNVLAPLPVRLLFFPRNDAYHLVHHLFPQIPARHLHRAHAELCRDPAYRRMPTAARASDAPKGESPLGAAS